MQIDDYLKKGREFPLKNNEFLMRARVKIYENLLDDFLDGIMFKFPLEEWKFIELKRNSIWLTKNIKNATEFRRKLSSTKNLKQLDIVLENIFDS